MKKKDQKPKMDFDELLEHLSPESLKQIEAICTPISDTTFEMGIRFINGTQTSEDIALMSTLNHEF